MVASKLNERLQIIASLAVFLGLILVVYELKLSNSVALAEHTRDAYYAWLDIASIEMEGDLGRVVIKSYEEPDKLTSEELFKLNAWLISIMSLFAYGHVADELGFSTIPPLIDEPYARYLFGSRYARQWFERNKFWVGTKNAEIISRVIQETPVMTKWPRYDEYYSNP